MSDYFVGEIRLFSFGRVPSGWVPCDGRSLPINQYAALYSLLGTQFGSTSTTFNLPDLRGRVPLSTSTNKPPLYQQGSKGGSETVALTSNQAPSHNHSLCADSTPGTKAAPSGNLYAQVPAGGFSIYSPVTVNTVSLETGTLTPNGGGAAHENMQPFQALNYCIATTGIYPSRP